MIPSDGAVPSDGLCRAPASRERLTARSAHPPPRADSNAAKAAANQSEGGSPTERTAGQACRRRMRNDGGARARAWIEPQVRVGRRVARAGARADSRSDPRGVSGEYVRARGRGRGRAGADAGGERLAGTGRGGRRGTGGRWGGEKGKWQSACGGARGESCARRRGARRGQPQPCGAWSHGPTRWCVRATRCGPACGAARGCGVGGRSGLGWWRVGPAARSRRNRAVVCQPCHAIAADRCCGDASRNACIATPVPIAPRRRVAGPRRGQERML